MTSIHDDYRELAAAGLDFELSQTERETLDGHLAGCIPCRRHLAGLQADQRAIAQLPAFVLSPAGATRVRRGSGQVVHRGSMPVMRLVAIAAMLALLAGATIAVGAEMLRRERDLNLAVVLPSPSDPVATPSDAFVAGSMVQVVVTDLRVRTAPTVDNTKSVKLDPLLGLGTKLRVIEGPVSADDYDWYLVQAIDLPHRGWVAAADHDGAPWIQDVTVAASAASAAPVFSADEAALLAALRPDAAVDCAPRRTSLPALAIAGIECRLGTTLVSRVGAYRFRDANDAATTYLERLASYAVELGTGDCLAGSSGDAAWKPGDGAAGTDGASVRFRDTGPWSVGRSGCFLDENGVANARATCGATYIGVLGRNEDLAAVQAWLWASPDGPITAGEPPGICTSGG